MFYRTILLIIGVASLCSPGLSDFPAPSKVPAKSFVGLWAVVSPGKQNTFKVSTGSASGRSTEEMGFPPTGGSMQVAFRVAMSVGCGDPLFGGYQNAHWNENKTCPLNRLPRRSQGCCLLPSPVRWECNKSSGSTDMGKYLIV